MKFSNLHRISEKLMFFKNLANTEIVISEEELDQLMQNLFSTQNNYDHGKYLKAFSSFGFEEILKRKKSYLKKRITVFILDATLKGALPGVSAGSIEITGSGALVGFCIGTCIVVYHASKITLARTDGGPLVVL